MSKHPPSLPVTFQRGAREGADTRGRGYNMLHVYGGERTQLLYLLPGRPCHKTLSLLPRRIETLGQIQLIKMVRILFFLKFGLVNALPGPRCALDPGPLKVLEKQNDSAFCFILSLTDGQSTSLSLPNTA